MPGPKEPEDVRREQILRAGLCIAFERGLDGLTIRAVAEEAGLSHGLVHFYFADKDTLILGLLDMLLEEVATRRQEHADSAVRRLVHQEIDRAVRDRDRIGLFFDFWVLGLRRPEVRTRMREELQRYRAWFAAAASCEFPGMARPPGAVASIAVALVQGAVLQSIIDPDTFDVDAVLAALDAVLPPNRINVSP